MLFFSTWYSKCCSLFGGKLKFLCSAPVCVELAPHHASVVILAVTHFLLFPFLLPSTTIYCHSAASCKESNKVSCLIPHCTIWNPTQELDAHLVCKSSYTIIQTPREIDFLHRGTAGCIWYFEKVASLGRPTRGNIQPRSSKRNVTLRISPSLLTRTISRKPEISLRHTHKAYFTSEKVHCLAIFQLFPFS